MTDLEKLKIELGILEDERTQLRGKINDLTSKIESMQKDELRRKIEASMELFMMNKFIKLTSDDSYSYIYVIDVGDLVDGGFYTFNLKGRFILIQDLYGYLRIYEIENIHLNPRSTTFNIKVASKDEVTKLISTSKMKSLIDELN